MNLAPCPDCAEKVSINAPTCPHCGAKLIVPKKPLLGAALIVFGLILALGIGTGAGWLIAGTGLLTCFLQAVGCGGAPTRSRAAKKEEWPFKPGETAALVILGVVWLAAIAYAWPYMFSR